MPIMAYKYVVRFQITMHYPKRMKVFQGKHLKNAKAYLQTDKVIKSLYVNDFIIYQFRKVCTSNSFFKAPKLFQHRIQISTIEIFHDQIKVISTGKWVKKFNLSRKYHISALLHSTKH